MRKTIGLRAALLGSGAALAFVAGPAFAGQNDDLQAQIDQLKTQLSQLEQQQTTPAPAQAAPAAPADAVVGGDFPGSFKLPGSDTSIRIRMLVKTDFIYDFDQSLGDSASWWGIAPKVAKTATGVTPGIIEGSTGVQARPDQFRFDARFSRLTFETRTPTDYGMLTTFISGDFWGGGEGPGSVGIGNANPFVTNSYTFALRDAFATLGPLLVGQTLTNLKDPESFGELLDHAGPAGEMLVVQPQIRYTQSFGKWTGSVSAEEPQSDFSSNANTAAGFQAAGVFGAGGSSEMMPDFTASLYYHDSWGHLHIGGLLRRVGFNDMVANAATTGFNRVNTGAIGGGGTFDGSFNMSTLSPAFGNDQLGFHGFYGSGIGRYLIFQGDMQGGDYLRLTQNANGTISGKMVANMADGGYVWYQHNWTPTLRSTIDFGIGHNHIGAQYNAAGAPIGQFATALTSALLADTIKTGYVNLLWSPLKQTTFGLEFMYGEKTFVAGTLPSGANYNVDVKRMMAEMAYSF